MLNLSLLLLTALLALIRGVRSSDIIFSANYSEISENESVLENLEIIYKEYKEQKNVTDLVQALQESEEERQLASPSDLYSDVEVTPDSWDLIEAVLKNTTTSTPRPPFSSSSTGACVKLASDVNIIFGFYRDQFQDAVAKCSRKSLGSHKNTFRCISKLSFGGLTLSDKCNDCWARTAHCGVKHCASQCLFSTCVAKCQKCSTRECSKFLNECAGTDWMPLPCGLDPHSPIPEHFKAADPK
ncbi:hypothetical protein OJ252_120 [Cryptosporidium canis]|uniref:TNFR-Cys domain-containing protein n=1 Tax=Cryptosporidium canis TaxID=195482 RepID=A0ABQ8PEL7_9CRYT|nr:hypothetical protein OJ252_120 [Cryptosporidium canis]